MRHSFLQRGTEIKFSSLPVVELTFFFYVKIAFQWIQRCVIAFDVFLETLLLLRILRTTSCSKNGIYSM